MAHWKNFTVMCPTPNDENAFELNFDLYTVSAMLFFPFTILSKGPMPVIYCT